jgi:hypothetical protein
MGGSDLKRGRTGICRFDPLDHDLAVPIEGVRDLISTAGSGSDGRHLTRARGGGAGSSERFPTAACVTLR